MPKVLLIEDEPSIADTIVYALQSECFEVVWACTGAAGLQAIAADGPPDCIVLDIGLPDMTGFDVCRALRQTSQIPVIFLTARDAELDRVLGLELGADDYMVKPFSPRELAARVRAILRRSQLGSGTRQAPPAGQPPAPQAPPETGCPPPSHPLLSHDTLRKRMLCRGQVLPLTRNEYLLLATLHAAPGRVFSRDQLMDAAWDDPASAMDRTVDAHIKSLRAKLRALAPDIQPIQTHRGLGYSME